MDYCPTCRREYNGIDACQCRTRIDDDAMHVPVSDTASRELPEIARRLRRLAGNDMRKTRLLVDALLHQIAIEERRDVAGTARRAGL